MNVAKQPNIHPRTIDLGELGQFTTIDYIVVDPRTIILLRPLHALLPEATGKLVSRPEWRLPGAIVAQKGGGHEGQQLVLGGIHSRMRQLMHVRSNQAEERTALLRWCDTVRKNAKRMLRRGQCNKRDHDQLVKELRVIEDALGMEIVNPAKVNAAAQLTQVTHNPKPDAVSNAPQAMQIFAAAIQLEQRLVQLGWMKPQIAKKLGATTAFLEQIRKRLISARAQLQVDQGSRLSIRSLVERCQRVPSKGARKALVSKLQGLQRTLQLLTMCMPYSLHARQASALIDQWVEQLNRSRRDRIGVMRRYQRLCGEITLLRIIWTLEVDIVNPLTTAVNAEKAGKTDHAMSLFMNTVAMFQCHHSRMIYHRERRFGGLKPDLFVTDLSDMRSVSITEFRVVVQALIGRVAFTPSRFGKKF